MGTINQFYVLYRDLSGVFGQWYNTDREWKFKSSHPNLDLSVDEMKYALSELDKVRKKLSKL